MDVQYHNRNIWRYRTCGGAGWLRPAMELLRTGVDCAVIALWLGHESVETTQIYLHAEPGPKERAMERTRPAGVPKGRYRPPDDVMAYLDGLVAPG